MQRHRHLALVKDGLQPPVVDCSLLIWHILVWLQGWSQGVLARATPLWYPEPYSGNPRGSYVHVDRKMDVTQPANQYDRIITRNDTVLAIEGHETVFRRSELWMALLSLLSFWFVYILTRVWQWLKSTFQTGLTDQLMSVRGVFYKQKLLSKLASGLEYG